MSMKQNKRCNTCRHNQTCMLDTGRALYVCDLDNSYIDNARLAYGRCEKWRKSHDDVGRERR